MNAATVRSVTALFSLILLIGSQALLDKPPLGWNSWDCFNGPGNQSLLYAAADRFKATLAPAGYDTMVVDMGWYYESSEVGGADMGGLKQRLKTNSTATADLGMHIDQWGRLTANPQLWPAGIAGAVKHIHSLGLKMGVHVMRGVNRAAVTANSPILDPATGQASPYTAGQLITHNKETCQWSDDFFAVNTSHPGAKLWYASNAMLYQEFGIDFIKADCYYGKRDEVAAGQAPFSGVDDSEILMFAASMADSAAGGLPDTRPIAISLSPGVDADTPEAEPIHQLVNMYRISDDLHDCWNNASQCATCGDGIRVTQQFERMHSHQRAGLVGAAGYMGKSWPDLDMLPVGPLQKPNALTVDEQRVAMTLWSVARAPMIIGTDVTKLDATSTATVGNPEVIRVNQAATESFQLRRDGPSGAWGRGAHITWVALLPDKSWALALFNIGDEAATVTAPLGSAECSVRDLWAKADAGAATGVYARHLAPHTAAFITLSGDRCPPPTAPTAPKHA